MPVQNSIIEQNPLYDRMPVGQEVIFVVSNQDAVATQTKVKFCAEVHISSLSPPNTSIGTDIIGTFKTTPNNKGVGIFDFRSIVENYVKADNMAQTYSSYKGTQTSNPTVTHPLHLIDKYSMNIHSIKFMVIVFYVEFLGADDGVNTVDPNRVVRASGTEAISNLFTLFNGYLKYTDKLTMGVSPAANDFGYDLSGLQPISPTTGRFLTNAPLTQYANEDDYGTFAFLVKTGSGSFADGYLDEINIQCYNSAGTPIGSLITVDRTLVNGAYNYWSANTHIDLIYFGGFPANLYNWSATFQTQLDSGNLDHYSVRGSNSAGGSVTQRYIINVNCPNGRGYESIRLCWLNQWGVWDYYTFTKKSIKTLSTKGVTYTQLQGTWNNSVYNVDSYKGGKKAFRVNSTEKIKMNTGFVAEDNNVIFEELMNSPEVYQLQGFQSDAANASLNQYVTPVRVTSTSFITKTVANDRLMQYTFEIEKTKTLRTQAI